MTFDKEFCHVSFSHVVLVHMCAVDPITFTVV